MKISELVEVAGKAAEAKGFHDDKHDGVEYDAMKIALMHSELSEALEELRQGHRPSRTYYVNDRKENVVRPTNGDGTPRKPEGVPSELADVVIRVADYCYIRGIDLEAIIKEKLSYNSTRGRLHGKGF